MSATPREVITRATDLVRSLLTQQTTPAGIVQVLADEQLLNPTVWHASQVPADDADGLVVWRAEHTAFPLGTYTTPEDARAHAEAHFRSVCRTRPTLAWYEEFPDASTAMALYATYGDSEVVTAYRVVPLTVLDHYNPDGES
ncbi:hypothetical protein C7C46_08810 [Streptomyces tateyamensis]|uniref:Uncharacterized protein n=1 Tax=Streptomyces tateyamensis TaxID=565073 RepID=A0A2V4P0Z0_9ACTN|nr:hypothetical protein [Streptomyces tateyamensis]PYC83427.1 hypothetical protein C7C46_08810 [Streptomyces tateyamensis]